MQSAAAIQSRSCTQSGLRPRRKATAPTRSLRRLRRSGVHAGGLAGPAARRPAGVALWGRRSRRSRRRAR
eukprot:13292074-Alexandrium_andersonii.AAC.1